MPLEKWNLSHVSRPQKATIHLRIVTVVMRNIYRYAVLCMLAFLILTWLQALAYVVYCWQSHIVVNLHTQVPIRPCIAFSLSTCRFLVWKERHAELHSKSVILILAFLAGKNTPLVEHNIGLFKNLQCLLVNSANIGSTQQQYNANL